MAYRFDSPSEFSYEPGALFLGLDAAGNEIGIKTEVHALTVGGSGAGKGAALLVQNARRWPHNLLLIDPKGENAVLSWEARERLGQRVVILDPFEQIPRGDIPDRLRASVNPLAEIDPASPRARASLVALGSGLVVAHDPRHMEWIEGARKMLAGVCAFVVANAPPETRTFAKVREIIMQADDALYQDAQDMTADDRLGGLIRNAGKQILTALESEKGMERDFLGNVRRATEWLDDEAIAATLNASTFRMSEIKTGAVSVYLVLPPDYVRDYAAFLRLFVKTALSAMGAPIKNGRECLFLLDEFYSLNKLDELTEAAGRMRSYGVHLWPFLQGLGQLYELYGKEGAQTFMTNAAAHVFLGCDQDPYTLRNISERIGVMTLDDIGVEPPKASAPHYESLWTPNDTWTPAKNQNKAAQASKENADARAAYDHALKKLGRPRLTPDEVAALIGKPDEKSVARSMIVFMPRGKVLNIRPAPYFKRNAPAAPGELIETKGSPAQAPAPSGKTPPVQNAPHILSSLAQWARFLADSARLYLFPETMPSLAGIINNGDFLRPQFEYLYTANMWENPPVINLIYETRNSDEKPRPNAYRCNGELEYYRNVSRRDPEKRIETKRLLFIVRERQWREYFRKRFEYQMTHVDLYFRNKIWLARKRWEKKYAAPLSMAQEWISQEESLSEKLCCYADAAIDRMKAAGKSVKIFEQE